MKQFIQTDNPQVAFQQRVRVLKAGEHVKYGEGKEAYEGYKHPVVVLTGEEFPPTADIHNRDQLQVGVYDLVVEMMAKGKIKTKNHYVFNAEETAKLK